MTLLRDNGFARLPEREIRKFEPLNFWRGLLIALPFGLILWLIIIGVFIIAGRRG